MYPHNTCISRRAKQVEISFKPKTSRMIRHLTIDATGLQVCGEGEWKFNNAQFGKNAVLLLIRELTKIPLRS